MRLIDADALIEAIPETDTALFENCGICSLLDKETIIDIILKQPTYEVILKKTGERYILECVKTWRRDDNDAD